MKDHLARLLIEARERTLALIGPLSEHDLTIQHSPLMSPIVWDLGHIANFEDLWLCRVLEERDLVGRVSDGEGEGLDPIYDAMKVPRSERNRLTLPDSETVRGYMRTVRDRVLERLEQVTFDPEDPLLKDGFIYRMVLQHEYQHNETILATLQLKQGAPYVPPLRTERPSPSTDLPTGIASGLGGPDTMVRFDGGTFPMGTDEVPGAYDNERPAHDEVLAPFHMDIVPVSNAAWMAFMEEGGYEREEFWSPAGWRHRQGAGLQAPAYWEQEAAGTWQVRSFDHLGPPEPDCPVTHITWYEAEAFTRFAGKRLPTESEWEMAAGWDPVTARKSSHPWGDDPWTQDRAGLDQLGWGPALLGAYPGGRSPGGCHQMLGDVWEWTASDFSPYPGFRSFPYPEYSAVHFGPEYKVLRGGSWATRPGATRTTFRNWDYPIRRQIFTGLRCAKDA